MKICFLADAASIHTQKWAIHFASKGNEVHIISFRDADINGVNVHHIDSSESIDTNPSASIFSKFGYVLSSNHIKKLIKRINPAILHAHWATSYGFLAALSGFHPFILSTWGNDIIILPKKYWIIKKIVEYNLKKADVVTATSSMLASATAEFIHDGKAVHTIPFGVDTNLFTPSKEKSPGGKICIGIVKALEEKYGIEYLIRAFKIISERGYESNLIIVGEGSLRKNLEELAESLSLANSVRFTGKVDNTAVIEFLHMIDIFIVPSISSSETFGVAALEASSCGIPVIASNIGGLPEVIVDGETGYLVPPQNEAAIAERIIKLIKNPRLRQQLGNAGRKFVLTNYEWNSCAKKMEEVYNRILR